MTTLTPVGADPWGPRAVSRALDVLDLLSHERDGLGLAELSQRLGVAKSTFLATLRGLARQGFLIHDAGRYRLGPAAYRLASGIMESWSAPEIVRHYVTALAAATRESVGFAVVDWEIGQVIYTDACNSLQPVHYAMRAGLRAPLHASAAGRILLAFEAPERTRAYLDHARLKRLTAATRTSVEDILVDLAAIRARGYCASFGEMLADTAAIAVPVYGPANRVIGALMVAAPIGRMQQHYDAILDRVRAAGADASGRAIVPHDRRMASHP